MCVERLQILPYDTFIRREHITCVCFEISVSVLGFVLTFKRLSTMKAYAAAVNEKEILGTLQEDASEAFALWQEKFGEYLLKFARYRVSCLSVAEDLVQETFLSAWRSRETFQGRSSMKTWLVQILKNKIIDHFHRSKRELAMRSFSREEGDQREEEKLEGTEEQNPELLYARRETLRKVFLILDCLPSKMRDAFVMRTVEERPAEEICKSLSLSESNLWVLVHRARQKLEKQLREMEIS